MQKIKERQRQILTTFGPVLVVMFFLLLGGAGWAYPISFDDAAGSKVTLSQPPSRIVSLVPGVTEIIAALDADQALVGITYHTTRPARLGRCAVVGGFMAPSLERIKGLCPDLIFISSMHEGIRAELTGLGCRVVPEIFRGSA